MKSKTHALLLALLLVPVLGAAAEEKSAPSRPPEVQAKIDQVKAGQKAEREAFRQKHEEERKAFEATLKDKKPEEKKALRREFRAKHKEERKAFHQKMRAERKAARKEIRQEMKAAKSKS